MAATLSLEDLVGKPDPAALRTSVKMTGTTTLPDAEAQDLRLILDKASNLLMTLNNLQADASLPDMERAPRLAALIPRSSEVLSDLLRLGGVQLQLLDSIRASDNVRSLAETSHAEAWQLQQRISRFVCSPDVPATRDDAHQLQALVLAGIERAMDVFASADRAAADVLDETGKQTKDAVQAICNEFLAGKEDVAALLAVSETAQKELVTLASRFSMFMTTLLQTLLQRCAFLPGELLRQQLVAVITDLRDLTPKLLLVAQGKLTEPGIADRILGAVDEGVALAKAVPKFSVRVECELVGGNAVDMAAARLRDAIAACKSQHIGAAARAFASEVTSILEQARALGISGEACDEVQRQLYEAMQLAKNAALSGSAEDIEAFEQAMALLNASVKKLPSRFEMVIFEESDDVFNAAKDLIGGGLTDLISSIQQ